MNNFDHLTEWYARFGNNLLALGNAIAYSFNHHHKLQYPSHSLIKNQIFDFGDNNEDLLSSNFYYNKFPNINMLRSRHKICNKYILPLLSWEFIKDIGTLIYLRGEDIFGNFPHPNYVQSPVSYLNYVLEIEKPNKITIIAQDNTNPLLNYLTSKYTTTNYINPSMNELISLFLSAPIIIQTGVTTLVNLLALCSTALYKIYIPIYEDQPIGTPKYKAAEDPCCFVMNSRFPDNVNAIWIKHNNYVKLGDWDSMCFLNQTIWFNQQPDLQILDRQDMELIWGN
jgi:hypothetical protein